jgi:hypothetical protein
MPGHDVPATLLTWLRARSDEQLVTLLALRPDLALPAPGDLMTLAARVGVRMSVQRAVDGLDQFTLRTLEALTLAAAPRTPEGIAALLGHRGDDPAVLDALERITALGLAWHDGAGLRRLASVVEVLGAYPGGIGRPAADLLRAVPDSALRSILRAVGLRDDEPAPAATLAARLDDPALIAAALTTLSDDERAVLERLGDGAPAGQLRGAFVAAEPGGEDSPGRALVARGLLIPIDAGAVELPREVGLALRGGLPWGVVATEAPPIAVLAPGARDVEASAATEVLTALRMIDELALTWSGNPPTSLRAGGIGVRDLRRTAKDLATTEPVAALLVEVAACAGLIALSSGVTPGWIPSDAYDDWTAMDAPRQWVTVAQAWLEMGRRPGLIGGPGQRERVVAALSPDVGRATVEQSRRHVLATLAQAPPDAAITDIDSVLARLAWESPRKAPEHATLAREVLGEAAALGVTGAGGLAGFARSLIAGAPDTAMAQLQGALPAPVEQFLLQPDLTAVVPGPPTPQLRAMLQLLGDLESSGGASVYRISEATIRRALDSGHSGADLRAFLSGGSRTPLPQALGYLIDDVARRHGVLRTGSALAYLRCDDAALLDRVLLERRSAPLGLRRLAPTVAVCAGDVGRVLEVLRIAGFAPMAEGDDGLVLVAGPSAARSTDRPRRREAVTVRRTARDQLAGNVARMRAGDRILSGAPTSGGVAGLPPIPGVTSARTLELLRDAIRGARAVGLAMAESEGTITARMLEPISLGGGAVRGYDPRARDRLISYPLHRITSVLDLGPVEGHLGGGGGNGGSARSGSDWEDVPSD